MLVSVSVNTSTKILDIGIETKNIVSPSTTIIIAM